jgi:predicted transcriptional regulator
LAEQVEKPLSALGFTKSWLLHNALQAYVASDQQFIDAVQEGLVAVCRSGDLPRRA